MEDDHTLDTLRYQMAGRGPGRVGKVPIELFTSSPIGKSDRHTDACIDVIWKEGILQTELEHYEPYRLFYDGLVEGFNKKLLHLREEDSKKVRQFPVAKKPPVMSHGTCSQKVKAARRKARKNKH